MNRGHSQFEVENFYRQVFMDLMKTGLNRRLPGEYLARHCVRMKRDHSTGKLIVYCQNKQISCSMSGRPENAVDAALILAMEFEALSVRMDSPQQAVGSIMPRSQLSLKFTQHGFPVQEALASQGDERHSLKSVHVNSFNSLEDEAEEIPPKDQDQKRFDARQRMEKIVREKQDMKRRWESQRFKNLLKPCLNIDDKSSSSHQNHSKPDSLQPNEVIYYDKLISKEEYQLFKRRSELLNKRNLFQEVNLAELQEETKESNHAAFGSLVNRLDIAPLDGQNRQLALEQTESRQAFIELDSREFSSMIDAFQKLKVTMKILEKNQRFRKSKFEDTKILQNHITLSEKKSQSQNRMQETPWLTQVMNDSNMKNSKGDEKSKNLQKINSNMTSELPFIQLREGNMPIAQFQNLSNLKTEDNQAKMSSGQQVIRDISSEGARQIIQHRSVLSTGEQNEDIELDSFVMDRDGRRQPRSLVKGNKVDKYRIQKHADISNPLSKSEMQQNSGLPQIKTSFKIQSGKDAYKNELHQTKKRYHSTRLPQISLNQKRLSRDNSENHQRKLLNSLNKEKVCLHAKKRDQQNNPMQQKIGSIETRKDELSLTEQRKQRLNKIISFAKKELKTIQQMEEMTKKRR